jgi:hypothetical protein
MKSRVLVASLGVALIAMLWEHEKPAIAEGEKRVLPIFQVDANFPICPIMELGGVGE